MILTSPFKQFLFFWIFSFIVSISFSFPASAAETPSRFTLNTDVRLQGVDTRNADLGTTGSDNVGTGSLEARVRLTGNITDNALVFWDGRVVFRPDRGGFQSEDTGEVINKGTFLEWRQSYLQFNNIIAPQTDLKIGRQKIKEDYGLWWNQNFDAIRLTYDSTIFKGFLAGGQNLFSYQTGNGDFTENDKDLARLLAEGSWQYYYNNFLETRLMFQNDHSGIAVGDPENPNNPDDRDGRLVWAGVRAAGKTSVFTGDAGKMSYRFDLMGVRGNEDVATIAGNAVAAITDTDVRGWGFDAATDIPLPNMSPLIHLGYAFGSGDANAADGTDHAFRQTGLDGNFSRIGALSLNTDSYGTVLRPQLSNIHVLSAGVTMPVLKASDIGAIYRYYRLDEPATSLVTSGVENVLNGTDRQLGQGVDFLFNMDVLKERQMNNTQLRDLAVRTSLGFFRSGDAYGAANDETAVRGLVELRAGF
jgi:alginate production protein